MNNQIEIHSALSPEAVQNGVFLVLLHADRIPPHIGLMADGRYHSLTIKGQEIDVAGAALLKNIALRRIPSVFIRIRKHPVFSSQHQGECFAEMVKQFHRVENGQTCLSPVRLFFEEFYAIRREQISLIFDLLAALKQNGFSEDVFGAHLGPLKENNFYLHPYNSSDLEQKISEELQKLKR